MQYLPAICLIFLILDCLSTTVTSATVEPYCNKNVTVISHKIVTKTRIKTVVKKGFLGIKQKKQTQVEVYEDYEPVHKTKVELGCCEGYKMNAFMACEPQCVDNGCPAHSRCVEPERCECNEGYISGRSEADGKHICEPICLIDCPEHSVCIAPNKCACKRGYKVTQEKLCEPHCDSGCPHGGECVAPNKCKCANGYKSEQGSCLDMCENCQNGSCLDENICICNDGFKWNSQLLKCESINWQSSTYYPDFTEDQDHTTDVGMTIETDIDTDSDDIDSNEVFDEIIPSTTYDPLDESSTSHANNQNHKCPDDHIYYKGQCHPLKFASNDIDCKLKPCEDSHAVCLENGACACIEGYYWFKMHVIDHDSLNHTIKAMCLTTEEYTNRLQQEQLNAENTNNDESDSNWSTIFFIVLGVLVMVCALVFLGFKLLTTQTGLLDVEGNNPSCSYDGRSCVVSSEKSVI